MKEFPNIFPICQKVIKFFQNINIFPFIIAQLAGGVFWPTDNATGAAAVDLMRRRTISRLSGDHVNQSRMRERGIMRLTRESKRTMSTGGLRIYRKWIVWGGNCPTKWVWPISAQMIKTAPVKKPWGRSSLTSSACSAMLSERRHRTPLLPPSVFFEAASVSCHRTVTWRIRSSHPERRIQKNEPLPGWKWETSIFPKVRGGVFGGPKICECCEHSWS